jgi:hypothetical protein
MAAGYNKRMLKLLVYFTFHALGTPLMMALASLVPGVSKEIGSNTTKINILLFIPIAIAIYLLWNSLTFFILHYFKPDLKFLNYLELKYNTWDLLACIAGLIALFVSSANGMEGNIFGFIFFLPLILSQTAILVLFVRFVYLLFK